MSAFDSRRKRLLLASAIFALALGFASVRVGWLTEAAGVRLSAGWVMTDFYSTAYYPIHAIFEGQTQYDRDSTYPPYAPAYLLLHVPFALLRPGPAGIAYFLFTALLTLVLAHLMLRLTRLKPEPDRVLLLAGAILLSRPGHWALLLGQAAILLTVVSYVAFLLGQRRPGLAGWALSAALVKPTYGLPLALLLWAWGRRRTAALGVGLAVLVNLPLVALLISREGGFRSFVGEILGGYQGWQDLPDVNPATSSTRTDAVSLLSRFAGAPLPDFEQVLLAALLLMLAAAVLRLLAKRDDYHADTLAIAIICLATSLIGFHRGYDLVLLSAPFLAAAVPGSLPPMSGWIRPALLVLFSILALNWIATESVLEGWQPSQPLWLLVTSLNGLILVALLVVYLLMAVRFHVRARTDLAPEPRKAALRAS